MMLILACAVTANRRKVEDQTRFPCKMYNSYLLNAPPSPVYAPTFSPLEDSEDEALAEQIVTTHTTMEVKTIDALNSGNVNLICSERDKMKLGGITKRHPLLFKMEQ